MVDGWFGEKGEWVNGQILILSKQEDKDNKWKVDEKKETTSVQSVQYIGWTRERQQVFICMINNP